MRCFTIHFFCSVLQRTWQQTCDKIRTKLNERNCTLLLWPSAEKLWSWCTQWFAITSMHCARKLCIQQWLCNARIAQHRNDCFAVRRSLFFWRHIILCDFWVFFDVFFFFFVFHSFAGLSSLNYATNSLTTNRTVHPSILSTNVNGNSSARNWSDVTWGNSVACAMFSCLVGVARQI